MNDTKQSKKTDKTPPDDDEPAKITFSLPQILSGALAAVTVAAVGSSLGTAGTIIGAALASVVGAVAGTLYTAGLHHTTRRIRTVAQRVRGSDQAANPAAGADETLVLEQVPDIFREAVGEPPPVERTRRALVLRVLVSAAAIFLLAFAAITVYELTVGAALDGSKGTTIGGSQRATTAKPTASATASATPTSTPTVTVTATAAPTPTATAPTTAPTVTVTSTPTAAAQPSTAPEPTTVPRPEATQASTP